MSDVTATASDTAAPSTPAAPAAATSAPALISMSQEAFNERLAQAKRSATNDTIKDLGVENVADAKARIAKAKELEEASKSEIQKLTDRVAALDPQAKRVSDVEAKLNKYADTEIAKLTEAQRASVLAITGEDKGRALEVIEAMRPTWSSAVAEPAKPAPIAAPATTASNAAAPAPAGAVHVDHKAAYATLKNENPIKAAAYLLAFPAAHPEHK